MRIQYAPELVDELHEVAVAAAREAADLAYAGQREGVTVAATKSSASDVVTEMDRRCEALLVDRILSARPDDGLLAPLVAVQVARAARVAARLGNRDQVFAICIVALAAKLAKRQTASQYPLPSTPSRNNSCGAVRAPAQGTHGGWEVSICRSAGSWTCGTLREIGWPKG